MLQVRGLYKGVTSPLAGVSLVNALVFGVYGNVQRCADSDSLGAHALAGGAAGAVQSVACSPVELAKTRLQLQGQGQGLQSGTARYSGPVDCLHKARKTHQQARRGEARPRLELTRR